MSDIKIGKNANVYVTWRTDTANVSDEEIEGVRSSFASKYGIKKEKIRVEIKNEAKNGGQASFNSENITNIHDIHYQQELFKVYIAEKGIKDCDFDEIIKIDTQVNSLIDYDKYEKGLKYRLNWIKWSNILSYGQDNFFDFTRLKGIVNIVGNPSNQSGKTTFADDIIHILLFGHTNRERASKNGEIFNRCLPDETVARIEGSITIGDCNYIISRTFTRPGRSKNAVRDAKQEVHFFRITDNGDRVELFDDCDNLEGSTTSETNKIITDTIGNEDDFNLIISANSKDLEDLISLKTTDRGRLLTRWVGLSPIEDKEEQAKKLWKSISSRRVSNYLNREELKNEIDEIKGAIRENNDKIEASNARISELNNSIQEKTNEIEVLLSSKRQIDDSVMKLDKATIEKGIKDTEESIGKEQKKLSEKLVELDEYKEEKTFNRDEYDNIVNEMTSLSETRGGLVKTYNTIKDEIDVLKKGEICPTCKRKLDNVDNSAAIEAKNAELEKVKQDGLAIKEKLTAYKTRFDELTKIDKYIQDKNKIQLSISAIKVNITNLESDLKDYKNSLAKLKECEDAIVANNKIDTRVNVIKANLDVDKKSLNNENNTISSLKAQNENNEKKIKENEANIKKIDEEVKVEKNWNTYLELVGKNGISKIVLRNTVPIINRKMNDLLEGVCNFKVEISVNEKDEVEFWMISNGIRGKLSSASGLERTAGALALRVVLGNMSNLSRPPFIVLDEIMGQIHEDNYDNFRELYERITKYYDFILHIAHANLDWNTQVVMVTKTDGISSVKLIET